MNRDEAQKQRDNCQHCHRVNLGQLTYMIPYCSACIWAKQVLADAAVTREREAEAVSTMMEGSGPGKA